MIRTTIRCVLLLTLIVASRTTQSSAAGDFDSSHGDSARATIGRLMDAGGALYAKRTNGSIDSAIIVFDSARVIAETHFGASDTAVASALNRLAMCYYWQNDPDRSEELYHQAIEIWEHQLGSEHPEVARTLRPLADSYAWKRSRFGEAEQLYRRSIRLLRDAPGHFQSELALTFNNLGMVLRAVGRRPEADSAFQRSIDIYETISGAKRHDVAYPMLNLSPSHMARREYAEAERLIRAAETELSKKYDRDHLDLAFVHNLLAINHDGRGQHDEALAAARTAVSIIENAFGADHFQLVSFLSNQSKYATRTGDHDGAVRAGERAMLISESELGPNHPKSSTSRELLAMALWAAGKSDDCLASYDMMFRSRREMVSGVFTYASEEQKLRYVRLYPLIHHPFLSFAIETNSQASVRSALDMVLFGKAAVIDAVSKERAVAYCSDDVQLLGRLKKHASIAERIAHWTLATTDRTGPSTIKDSLSALYAEKDELETEISRRCADFGAALHGSRHTVDDVARSLPDSSVLLEFVKYRGYDIAQAGSNRWWGPMKYAAFTLDRAGRVGLIDLGEARPIDSLIREYREEMRAAPAKLLGGRSSEQAAEKVLAAVTREVGGLILDPLVSAIAGANHILVSPDGELNLLPFEILPTHEGRYATEEYRISYLSSGRDLLKLREHDVPTAENAIIVTDPDYDSVAAPLATPLLAQLTTGEAGLPVRGPGGNADCLSRMFTPLPATTNEGESIVRLLSTESDLRVLHHAESEASEDLLKRMPESPKILHLATHGYFCSASRLSGDAALDDNPLLYSGLALAGANRMIVGEVDANAGTEDGILTALEASGLNLIGTELVVLSACQSGVGDIIAGEGIYGLRRALQHAGARSVVTSMFTVPDQATVALMTRFYGNWIAGDSKATALRNASLSTLRERREITGAAHPLFWGGFVLVGDPN